MNKLYFFIAVILLISCNNPNKISITKVEGSPEYSNSVLKMNEPIIVDEGYKFSFDVNQYELGMQTLKDFDYQLANSAKGQHIHFIVNNGPYSAHYENIFSKKLKDSSNVILAFLSRSYHESVKNKNAFVLTQVGEKNIDLNNEFLFYSMDKLSIHTLIRE